MMVEGQNGNLEWERLDGQGKALLNHQTCALNGFRGTSRGLGWGEEQRDCSLILPDLRFSP